ncbi:SDR family oxidoreductase [Streptomyces gardneri]|uniref:SDR family oxidoreductase n=1 Tax=Streptomyces gardneri TaxID=66892 RepID=UPI00368867A3
MRGAAEAEGVLDGVDGAVGVLGGVGSDDLAGFVDVGGDVVNVAVLQDAAGDFQFPVRGCPEALVAGGDGGFVGEQVGQGCDGVVGVEAALGLWCGEGDRGAQVARGEDSAGWFAGVGRCGREVDLDHAVEGPDERIACGQAHRVVDEGGGDGEAYGALTGRRFLEAGCEQVAVDLRVPRLGLDAGSFALLAKRVDVIVHMAGNVDYTASVQDLHAVNEGGAAGMTALADAAECLLLYVSTAFADRHTQASREAGIGALTPARPSFYHRSKAAADERVRQCSQPWSIIRPSIVMGDSRDGSMLQRQTMHQTLSMMSTGLLPAMFGHPDHLIDMVPRDYVAQAIHQLALDAVEGRPLPREFWATAGPASLTWAQWSQVLQHTLAAADRITARPSGACVTSMLAT